MRWLLNGVGKRIHLSARSFPLLGHLSHGRAKRKLVRQTRNAGTFIDVTCCAERRVMMRTRRIGSLMAVAVLLAGVGMVSRWSTPAFALWGDTGMWKKNVNVLKIRSDELTGLDIPEIFGDPISAGTGCHAYVIGVDEANGKVCAITAQHCLPPFDKAYGDNFPEGTPIEQKLNVASDIGLIRVADELFWTYDHIKRALPRMHQPVRVVSRTQEEGLPGRAIYCRGRIYALHPGQIDDGFEVNLTNKDCEQGRSATGYTFDRGSAASGEGIRRRAPAGRWSATSRLPPPWG